MLTAEKIETLKQNYTDKYVVVDARRPELARFRDHVGQVKTINMSGRALVQFADFNLNIGWYDIDLGYLKVVEKPELVAKQPAEKKPAAPAKKPVASASANGEEKLSPLEMARLQGAKQLAAAPVKAAPAGKPSTADILAAARGGAATKAAPAVKAPAAPKESAPAAATAGKKMSTADILAMARGKGSTAVAAAPAKAPAEKLAPPPAPEPVTEATSPAPTTQTKPATGKVDKSSMTVDQMIAWCREHDTK